MVSKTYHLVNPTIVGTFDSSVNSKNAKEAMETLWNRLAEHIEGNVPSFHTTLQVKGSNKLYHFKITESVDGKNAVADIEQVKVKLNEDQKKQFLTQANKVTAETDKKMSSQNGGRRHIDDSSSSDSDSDSEYYHYLKYRKNLPISLAWYAPTLYSRNSNLNLFIPVWRRPHFVYNQLWVSPF
jgi:hypothetical protein